MTAVQFRLIVFVIMTAVQFRLIVLDCMRV
jgi:hypothetical protein